MNAYGKKHSKGPRKQLRVVYQGKNYEGNCAADVFVEVLRDIGFERVSALGILVGSSELVSRSAPGDFRTHRQCGEWFVKTHSTTSEKHSILERVGRRLSLGIEILVMDLSEQLLA